MARVSVGHQGARVGRIGSNVRVSPDGSIAAVTEDNVSGGGWLTFVDRKGQAKRMSGEFSGIGCGLVWTGTGNEAWFTASEVGLNFGIHGVTRGGVQRVVHRGLGSQCIQDLARDGRALMLQEWGRAGMVTLAPGEQRERELSWFDWATPNSLSADGRMVSFTESGAGAGPDPSAFVRLTDGSPAIRIAKGQAGGISPDGTHMLLTDEDRQALKVVPIGAGDIRRIDTGSPKTIAPLAVWTPDGTRIVFAAREGTARRACSSCRPQADPCERSRRKAPHGIEAGSSCRATPVTCWPGREARS